MELGLIIKKLLTALRSAPKRILWTNTYENLLKRHRIRYSYSKQGYSYDNSSLETFHLLLKLDSGCLLYTSDAADE